MRLDVLGCHGGELPRHRTTCFLFDEVLALDAGALTSSLALEQLLKVDDIVVSHSHFDHVKDLPLLADLIVGQREKPVVVHASTLCAKTLRENMFNDELWPDFTRIPSAENPVLRIVPFEPGSRFQVGRFSILSVPVNHPVESCGFVISEGGSSVAMSGDTGPTEALWQVLRGVSDLKAVLLETSFPNRLQWLADTSGHLTPHTLAGELNKLDRRGAEVLLYHLKPAFMAELREELRGMPVQLLELGERFEF